MTFPNTVAESHLFIRGGSLFDPDLGEMRPVGAITVEGDRIVEVLPAGGGLIPPTGATIIEAEGKWIIPGLIDAHVHLVHVLRDLGITGDEVFPLFLANGITALRDVGDELTAQKLLHQHSEAHPENSPRLFMSSPLIEGAHPYHAFVSKSLTDVDQVPEFIREMDLAGVQTIKLYTSVERTVGHAVIQEAHRHGKWVTAHLQWGYRAQDAIADGVDSLEHTESLLEFILPPGSPRWPELHERPGIPPDELAAMERQLLEIKADLDLDHPRVTALIDSLVRHDVAVTPTLVVYKNWVLLRDLPEVQQHPDLQFMPDRMREGWLKMVASAPLPETTRELRRRQYDKLCELTARLYRAGVTLMVGTDTPVPLCPPGLSMHQEFELLVEAGVPPAAVLTGATRNAAKALNQSDQLGSIAPGKLADLVILDGDPLDDIRNTRKIHQVIRSGIVVDRS